MKISFHILKLVFLLEKLLLCLHKSWHQVGGSRQLLC